MLNEYAGAIEWWRENEGALHRHLQHLQLVRRLHYLQRSHRLQQSRDQSKSWVCGAGENGPRPKCMRRPVSDASEREQSEVMDGGREEEEEYRGNEEERDDDEVSLEEEDRLVRENGDLGKAPKSDSCYLVYALCGWKMSECTIPVSVGFALIVWPETTEFRTP
jgi:hypothetical protein